MTQKGLHSIYGAATIESSKQAVMLINEFIADQNFLVSGT